MHHAVLFRALAISPIAAMTSASSCLFLITDRNTCTSLSLHCFVPHACMHVPSTYVWDRGNERDLSAYFKHNFQEGASKFTGAI